MSKKELVERAKRGLLKDVNIGAFEAGDDFVCWWPVRFKLSVEALRELRTVLGVEGAAQQLGLLIMQNIPTVDHNPALGHVVGGVRDYCKALRKFAEGTELICLEEKGHKGKHSWEI